MLFIEAKFIAFFFLVFSIYWLLPTLNLRKLFLLFASYAFYAAWDYRFLALIGGCTVVNFYLGTLLSDRDRRPQDRWILVSAVIANMGVLAIFKYFNFFADSLFALGQMFGLEASYTALHIVLPVGISFYLFQTTSYVVDIYRKDIRACDRLVDFAVYVAFFPQLIAGPIVRASEFLPQLGKMVFLADIRMRYCLFLFAVGFFKKACVADNLAVFVDPIFADVHAHSAYTLWLGALLYSIQLYCDFSGYSDMAIALAGLLGFHLPKNFHFPYFSSNLGVFWQRWHITLSTWLRDYVYFPVGGSREPGFKTYRNLMITFGLNGLWHGGAWGFVLWGLGNGIGVCFYRAWSKSGLGRLITMPHLLAVALVFAFIVLVRVPFRTPDVMIAVDMYGAMFGILATGTESIPFAIEPVLLALAFIHWIFYRFPIFEMVQSLPRVVFASGMGGATALALGVLPMGHSPFIYFQF